MRIETTDMGVLLALFLALGCDAELPVAKDIYKRVKGAAFEEGRIELTIVDCARMISLFVDEHCDPVEGLLEAVTDALDPEKTGVCALEGLKAFLESHDYLGAAPDAVMEVLEQHCDGEAVDYVKAIKNLIQ